MTTTHIQINQHAPTNFFINLGVSLGLPDDLVQRIAAGEAVLGPAGMLCRVHMQPHKHADTLAAFPEVILPIAARELGGDDVVKLLALQEHLLTEYGWRLTLSNLGLLCVCPLIAAHSAEDVAAVLDRGQTIARLALEVLVAQTDESAAVVS
ncbi:Hpa3 family type III secretion system protein [Xanthomonas fragariae]|uniref:Hpa3 protein, type III secretion system n=1 Tax=Xanthomonas fragariae TaxID=48664 RepID=A0A1Y6HKT0_9XANT|nr:Hpa3 family type III secretion system protein [Xanthomonas fragariae]MDM7573342.1 Hpa3 family type III secretion system protein [Xanthomonas fragariae]MDM7582625.1 Hpa3 family type III secretion system protein [Xanthomonas fragariae]MEA5174879.1 Hpa3 family type III secretion system protein [Xanthomonas fragariae]MEA5187574.1 Hpa3 family type III secretion system protein [Xanthomonas fragariae]MEA5199487.1 Hpa3 family type III secretion system protein [Xanthomonas fragariae]